MDRNKTVRPERRQLELPSATHSPISVEDSAHIVFLFGEGNEDLCAGY